MEYLFEGKRDYTTAVMQVNLLRKIDSMISGEMFDEICDVLAEGSMLLVLGMGNMENPMLRGLSTPVHRIDGVAGANGLGVRVAFMLESLSNPGAYDRSNNVIAISALSFMHSDDFDKFMKDENPNIAAAATGEPEEKRKLGLAFTRGFHGSIEYLLTGGYDKDFDSVGRMMSSVASTFIHELRHAMDMQDNYIKTRAATDTTADAFHDMVFREAKKIFDYAVKGPDLFGKAVEMSEKFIEMGMPRSEAYKTITKWVDKFRDACTSIAVNYLKGADKEAVKVAVEQIRNMDRDWIAMTVFVSPDDFGETLAKLGRRHVTSFTHVPYASIPTEVNARVSQALVYLAALRKDNADHFDEHDVYEYLMDTLGHGTFDHGMADTVNAQLNEMDDEKVDKAQMRGALAQHDVRRKAVANTPSMRSAYRRMWVAVKAANSIDIEPGDDVCDRLEKMGEYMEKYSV